MDRASPKESQETAGGISSRGLFAGQTFAFIKAMKITEILLAEHAVFHNLFDHIEKTAPRLKTLAEVKSLAALLESVLRAHSLTEDELLIEPGALLRADWPARNIS